MSDCKRINWNALDILEVPISPHSECIPSCLRSYSANDSIPNIVTRRFVDHKMPLLEARNNNCSRGKQPMDLLRNFQPSGPLSSVQVVVPLSELSGRD